MSTGTIDHTGEIPAVVTATPRRRRYVGKHRVAEGQLSTFQQVAADRRQAAVSPGDRFDRQSTADLAAYAGGYTPQHDLNEESN